MLGDDDLGVLAQGDFDHLYLLEGLGVADKVLVCGFVNKADGFSLALGYLDHHFAFSLGELDGRQLFLFGRFELARCQQRIERRSCSAVFCLCMAFLLSSGGSIRRISTLLTLNPHTMQANDWTLGAIALLLIIGIQVISRF